MSSEEVKIRQHALMVAEMNLKLNEFSKRTILSEISNRQKALTKEREKLVSMLKLFYPGCNIDHLLNTINSKGKLKKLKMDEIQEHLTEAIELEKELDKKRIFK